MYQYFIERCRTHVCVFDDSCIYMHQQQSHAADDVAISRTVESHDAQDKLSCQSWRYCITHLDWRCDVHGAPVCTLCIGESGNGTSAVLYFATAVLDGAASVVTNGE